MNQKYKLINSLNYTVEIRAKNFDDVLVGLKQNHIYSSFKVIDKETESDVTKEFKQYESEKGFVFGEDLLGRLDKKIADAITRKNSFYTVYYYEGKKGLLVNPCDTQYDATFQELLKLGYVYIGHLERHSIYIEADNPNSPVYKYSHKDGIYPDRLGSLVQDSTVLEKDIGTFLEKIDAHPEESWSNDDESDNEGEEYEIEEKDLMEYKGEVAVKYRGETYQTLCIRYRNVDFCYAPIELAEYINDEEDSKAKILKKITAFVEDEDYKAMREMLEKRPDWRAFSRYCVENGIMCFLVLYYGSLNPEIEVKVFNDEEYPLIRIEYHNEFFAYTTKKAVEDKEFVKYMGEMEYDTLLGVSEEVLEKLHAYLYAGRLYQEFEKFCKENDIKNILPCAGINDKDFDFDFDDDEEEIKRPPLPDGYSEEGEETLEVSEEEYKELSKTLDRFLTGENPRWQKDTETGETLEEFVKNTWGTSICGYVTIDIKRETIDWHEFCRNNNALVHEQFRNVTKFQNVLRDAIMCSNSLYTDLLNIKELASEKMCENSRCIFLIIYNETLSKIYPNVSSQKADFELRGRYRIEGTGKPVFDRVSFTSLENVFDAICVTDIKPPFKVLDTESGEDVTDKVMQIAEKEDYVFIDSEEIIKVLPKSFEEFSKDSFSLKYTVYEDRKQISCMNMLNFKNIIGFKSLWAKNCVPFGYKRNFVLFVDLNQNECPVYRIDYRKTAEFESRKLLAYTAKDFMDNLSSDISV